MNKNYTLLLKNKILLLQILVFAFPLLLLSQVKVGDNPSLIHSNSILELESNDKVFVLTRLSTSQINTLAPLEGALVYNTDEQCIFAFDGSTWKNLCDAPSITQNAIAPVNNQIGDFWINTTNNITSIWNGTQWLPININPRRGNGAPTITNAAAGDIYVDETNGNLYTYNGTTWSLINQMLNVDNGLSITSNTIQLGGVLVNPTIITTNSTNTFAIQGMEDTALDDTNSVVVTDNVTGVLKKVSASNLIQQEQVIIIANNGQLQFTPPLDITDINKIDVYRNGVRIAFTQVNATTIEIEPEARCYSGDEIRIVQIN